MEIELIERLVGTRAQVYGLAPELEALGWLLAERLCLTDAIFSTEWVRRVEDGDVSPEAVQVINAALAHEEDD